MYERESGNLAEFDYDDTIKYKRKELISKILTKYIFYDENDRTKFFEEDRDEGSLSAAYSISRQPAFG